MATLDFAVDDVLANKLWSKKLDRDTLQEVYFSGFIGESSDSLVQIKTETQKAAGDKVTFALRNLLSGRGKSEGETLYGNEEKMVFNNDAVYINELFHATEIPTNGVNIAAERVPYNLREEGNTVLKDWNVGRFETWFFNQLAGNTAEDDLLYLGNNAVTAPSTNRIVRAGGQVTDQALTSSDTFDLSLIDVCVEMARTMSPRLRPCSVAGRKKYALFLHEYQATDLRRSTGAGEWFDIARMQGEGGKTGGSNPIFTTALGEYHDTMIYRSSYLPQGVHSTTNAVFPNTRRAVFCGAQAAALAFGKGFGNSRMRVATESKDYGRTLGISCGTIAGMKKTVYDSEDYGVITIPTYAAKHTS